MNKLTDEEKSVMLAHLCGWGVSKALAGTKYESIFIYTQDNQRCTNLYDPANMPLAWRVLNLAMDSDLSARARADIMALFYVDKPSALEMSPAEAQRAWLDKILELAIEAGMIENGH